MAFSRSRRIPLLRTVSAAAAAGVLIVSAGGYAAARRYDAKIQRVEVFGTISGSAGSNAGASTPRGSDEVPASEFQPMNVLLVGIDNREGLTREQEAEWHVGHGDYGNQTDTIMIAHIGRNAEHVTLVSLPRDSLVTIPAHTDSEGVEHSERNDKINAAFTIGGPSLLVKTVERATGIPIDHYAGINFAGFVNMVEAVDGVDVCLAEPIKDNPKYTSLDLPAGKSTIRGGMALSFVRARHVGTDFGRIQRQQQFLASLLNKATSLGIVGNPVRLDQFVSSVTESLTVDETLTRDDILRLANSLSSIRLNQIEFARLPIADDNYTDPSTGRGGYVLWKKEPAQQMFDAMIADTPLVVQTATPKPKPTVSASDATVEPQQIEVVVLNASGTPGRAKEVTAELADLGYSTGRASTSEQRVTTTVVRYDSDQTDALKTLRQTFPGATFTEVPGMGSTFEVLVGSSDTAVIKPVVTPVVTAPTYDTNADPTDVAAVQKPVLASTTVCQ